MITKLMRFALDAELESLKDKASDHALAWKVFGSLKETRPSVPIPPSTLVDHFESIMAPKDNKFASLFVPFTPVEGPLTKSDSEFAQEFSSEELQSAVAKINMSSAPGPDGITPQLAKDLFKFLPFFLYFLMFANFCFFAHWTPDAWRVAEIFILYKGKGDPCSPDSYRGIALCSILAKVYERLLVTRLTSWWYSKRRSSASQFGFRLGSSTLDAVFILKSLIYFVCRQHHSPLHCAFVDLRKAFPSVARAQMFHRLQDIGVPLPLILAIRSLYILNTARLRVGSCLSRPFLVSLGLLEGSLLSPLLFIIVFSFVWDALSPSDFPDHRNPSVFRQNDLWILAFADDLVLLSPSRDRLMEALKTLDVELSKYNLSMSLQKTEVMTFHPRSPNTFPPLDIQIRGTKLTQVGMFRYLGVAISSIGSLHDHLVTVTQKARIASMLTANLINRLAVHQTSRIHVYFQSFIQAQFYGLELMPVSILDEISSIRGNFLRHLFRLPRGTPSDLFYVLFPSYTPAILCLKRRLAFYKRALRHELPVVSSCFINDLTVSYQRSCGWMYDSYLIYRSLYPQKHVRSFDFVQDVGRLMDVSGSVEHFSFIYLKNTKLVCLSFFAQIANVDSLTAFRTALSSLELPYQHVLLSFFANQTRWCFLSPPSRSCPLCYTESWYWEHFLSCPVVVPMLSTRQLSLVSFRAKIRAAVPAWTSVFSDVAMVHLIWHFALSSLNSYRHSLMYNADVFRSLLKECR